MTDLNLLLEIGFKDANKMINVDLKYFYKKIKI